MSNDSGTFIDRLHAQRAEEDRRARVRLRWQIAGVYAVAVVATVAWSLFVAWLA